MSCPWELLYGRVPLIMPNALGNIDNGYLPSKCPIHPRNPPEVDFRIMKIHKIFG
jgi:hypothetical protein